MTVLQGRDSEPVRHQVLEVPPPVVQVREYQLHRLVCARCGLTPWGTLPPGRARAELRAAPSEPRGAV